MCLYDVVEKGKSSALAAEQSLANACEMGIAVEFVAVEDGDGADVLHVPVFHYGVEDNLLVHVHILKLVPRDVLEERRHWEDGSCAQPAAHVVAGYVSEHGVVGNLENAVLKLFQGAHPHHFLVGLGVAEYEIAESHVLLHYFPEVDVHGLGVLVNETEMLRLRLLLVYRLCTLEDEWYVFVAAPYLAQQFQSCLRVFLSMHGETHVANDPKRVVVIPFVEVHGFLVVPCKYHLWPSSHPERCRMAVQCFCGEALALQQQVSIEVGEYGGIEPYAVLDEENHLHASLLDVMLKVHLVLYKLDD